MTQRMIILPPAVRDHMRASNAVRTDEGMRAMFGISYNTWKRIDGGDPIRASLASRLLSRMGFGEEKL
ncbi:MAG: hypothetical protein BGP16_14510 [Sphingobium sp. 66-54]|nr:MAG: hypothetical protein BGP16_14510 [Sphingobium sp. 66-54]